MASGLRRKYVVLALIVVLSAVGLYSQKLVEITSVSCRSGENSVTYTFEASDTISSFQKPEMQKDLILLRIPDALPKVDLAVDCPSVEWHKIRNVLLFRVPSSGKNCSASVKRIGPRTIELSVTNTSPTPKSPVNTAWALDVIVIDAGHGGVDAGAEGVNGEFEKNVTLSLAKQLRDRLKSVMPAAKIVMTRDSDKFVELYKRTQIANEAGGKLFVSIHCNSMPTKPHPANGCETYILRPGRNDDAARVAKRENASVKFESSNDRYKELDEEQIIVSTMAQRSFVRFSEHFASILQRSVSKETPLKNRGVNQAGFFVLVGASMPNVLFETAFLSNEKDTEFICSESGQKKIVESMTDAIVEYANFYKKSLGN